MLGHGNLRVHDLQWPPVRGCASVLRFRLVVLSFEALRPRFFRSRAVPFRVKGISMSNFTLEEADFLAAHGNKVPRHFNTLAFVTLFPPSYSSISTQSIVM